MLSKIITGVLIGIFNHLWEFVKEEDRKSVLTKNAVLLEIIKIKDQEPKFKILLEMNAADAEKKMQEAIDSGKEDEAWNEKPTISVSSSETTTTVTVDHSPSDSDS